MAKHLIILSFIVGLNLVFNLANAENLLSYLTDANGIYIGPTVEENILKMDTYKMALPMY